MSADTATTHTNAPATLRGQCLCGAVRYAVTNAFRYAFNCHCSQCRRATGSAFKPFAGIESEALRLTAGEGQTLVYGDPQAAHDVHCGRCGSLLYSVVREGAYVHVTLGTLADTPDIRPTGHIFVRSKAPWFEIADSLPQYDEFPP
ncbi:GFA family protein [Paraburkholderia flagellata]|uniref:GFA family protein n=1 Tax=Paraburkholderia flagellata TaxID=2883241 RepID=UPI001F3D6433|nr:GFA family protein [Paraburkholderia flagellata]